MRVPLHFEKVLKLFESRGFKMQHVFGTYRVFIKEGELPWIVPVHDRKVDAEYVKKFKEFLKERGKI